MEVKSGTRTDPSNTTLRILLIVSHHEGRILDHISKQWQVLLDANLKGGAHLV
jgi:hypothetical protein